MDLPNKSAPQVPAKKVTPIMTGVVQVPRPATRRFIDYLFAESPKALGAKIARDVIVPRFKAGVEEALNNFVSGMMWGVGGRPMGNIVAGQVLRGGVSSYSQISTQNAMGMAMAANPTRSSGNYQDLQFPTQEKAEQALANLYQLLNQYNVVAVGDLYDLVSITSAPSDNAYGWRTLDGARISRVRDGYLLELPRPTLI